MPMPLQGLKFKLYLIIYSVFSVFALLGSILDIPFLLNIGTLGASCVLGIASLAILKSAVSFHRFLFWIVSFLWSDFFFILSILIVESHSLSLPIWFNNILFYVSALPSLFLLITCIEIIYLIRERIDATFFWINFCGLFIIFSIFLYSFAKKLLLSSRSFLVEDWLDFIDFFPLLLISVVIASFPLKQMHKTLTFTLFSIAFYAIVNVLHVFFPIWTFSNNSIAMTVLWLIYFIPPLLLTIAFFNLVKYSGQLINHSMHAESNLPSFSFCRIRVQYVLFLISLLAFLFQYIDLAIFLLATLILIIYLLISTFYRVFTKNQQYIQKQKNLHDELKEEVTQRNIELLKQNIKLQEVVNRDFLTNAYNRRYLQELLSILNEDAQLFAIDILQFNNINQVFGDSVGDSVLIHLYQILQQAFPTQLIFRVDSNEYVILFRGTIYDINEISRKIFDVVSIPFVSEFYKISLDVGVGISIYSASNPDDKPDSLLTKANFALNEVKSSVIQPRILVYDQTLADKKYRYGLIQSLLDSINYDDEFRLFFQPQYTSDGNILIGMEALLRWTNPKLGMVSPAEFIPIAEESSTIIKIVEWTLKKACLQVKEWNSKYDRQLKVGINLSPKYIEKPDFYESLQKLVLAQGLNVNWLDLEITETSVMHLDVSVIDLFKKLSGFGISTSIDDFGTGYSSLSYIKNLKISTLKIAKELVDSLSQDSSDALIVNAIIKMAQGLNIKTIAEGVETKEQLSTLYHLGCDYIQGYYFGKPLPAEEFVKMHL